MNMGTVVHFAARMLRVKWGILLIEDDARVRGAMARSLGRFDDLAIVGEAADGATARELLDLTPALEFHVAFVDLDLGKGRDAAGSGIDVIRAIRRLRPGAAPVALTVFDDRDTVTTAILAGARGYVLKDIEPDALASVVRDAAKGGAPMSAAAARWVLDMIHERDAAPELTPRERELVSLLCEGRTYQESATALGITVGTVQSYVKAVYAKLEVASKAELTAVAFRRGLVR